MPRTNSNAIRYDLCPLLGRKLISTNKSKSGKTYAAFEFVCNETGVYYLKAHFAAGTKGCGSASLSMSK